MTCHWASLKGGRPYRPKECSSLWPLNSFKALTFLLRTVCWLPAKHRTCSRGIAFNQGNCRRSCSHCNSRRSFTSIMKASRSALTDSCGILAGWLLSLFCQRSVTHAINPDESLTHPVMLSRLPRSLQNKVYADGKLLWPISTLKDS